ncbi:MAG TPA: anti-sigma factor [Burkholderiales bacterium]|nr:anti-sigma factor [Burkholderiales bacterium]
MNCKDKPELRERLAAEYALGTLRGRARERLKRWMRDDAELAREVAKWEARLAPLAQAVAPVAPPARVWNALQTRLEGARDAGHKLSFSVWKALGWMASGAAAALIAVAILLPSREPAHAAYVAVLSDPKTTRAVLVATAGQADKVLRVNTLDPSIQVSGRSLELWALPRDGKPKSLGVIGAERAALRLDAPADKALGNVPALAISLEPPGGSPTGQPTGPVLYSGPCVKYW